MNKRYFDIFSAGNQWMYFSILINYGEFANNLHIREYNYDQTMQHQLLSEITINVNFKKEHVCQ